MRSLLDQLGDNAKRRPEPRLPDATLAGAGTLVAVGLVVVGGGDSASPAGIAILGVLVVAAFYAAVLLGQRWLLPAATAAVSVGIVGLVIGVFDGPLGDGDWALPLFVLAALAIAAYLLPGLRGRTFLLGLGLTALLFALGWIVGQSARDDFDDVEGGFGLAEPDLVTSISQDAAIVLLIIGAVYVVAAIWLDRHGYAGVATAFIVGAILGLASGSTGAVADSGQAAQALLLLLAGVVLAAAGHLGHRHATTWIGVAFVTLGAGAFVVALGGDDPAPAAVGLLLALAGGGLGALAWWLLAKHPLDRFAPDEHHAGADGGPPEGLAQLARPEARGPRTRRCDALQQHRAAGLERDPELPAVEQGLEER